MLSGNIIANTAGILSLITSLGILVTFWLNWEKFSNRKRIILDIFRLGLMLTISLGLIHGLLMTQKVDLDFYTLNTYWLYVAGLFVYNLFVFLALTFSELKSDLKKLNYFSYAALFLILCHIVPKIIF